jgi:hypothetical protein
VPIGVLVSENPANPLGNFCTNACANRPTDCTANRTANPVFDLVLKGHKIKLPSFIG